jgi:nucleotide-binding universal stress UspA family protein
MEFRRPKLRKLDEHQRRMRPLSHAARDAEARMIRDVMVSLDGTPADEVRLSAVTDIAEYFEVHVTALFLNVLPELAPAEWDGIGARTAVQILQEARENSERVVAKIRKRLATLQMPVELRRIDVPSESQGEFAAREARVADVFVGLRPNGSPSDTAQVLESVLFETGRHLFLAPERRGPAGFDRIMVAWNGSREATRATAEAMPYLLKAERVDVVVVQDSNLASPIRGTDLVDHLLHHGVGAELHEVRPRAGGIAATLMADAKERSADMIVMGAYGHSRLREWLLGGTTYQLLHQAPMPLVVAH